MLLYLHIGIAKTATTTIQNYVCHNRRNLLDRGIALSDILEKPSNRNTFFRQRNENHGLVDISAGNPKNNSATRLIKISLVEGIPK